jgi:hypothetical protein
MSPNLMEGNYILSESYVKKKNQHKSMNISTSRHIRNTVQQSWLNQYKAQSELTCNQN